MKGRWRKWALACMMAFMATSFAGAQWPEWAQHWEQWDEPSDWAAWGERFKWTDDWMAANLGPPALQLQLAIAVLPSQAPASLVLTYRGGPNPTPLDDLLLRVQDEVHPVADSPNVTYRFLRDRDGSGAEGNVTEGDLLEVSFRHDGIDAAYLQQGVRVSLLAGSQPYPTSCLAGPAGRLLGVVPLDGAFNCEPTPPPPEPDAAANA